MTHPGNTTQDGNPHDAGHAKGRPVVTFDVSRYEHFLEDQGLSAEQKRAMLEALWSIIVSFVDLGFGVHPVQQACGQNDDEDYENSGGVLDEVYSDQSAQIIEGKAVVLNAAGEVDS
jgi:hypothetical protein